MIPITSAEGADTITTYTLDQENLVNKTEFNANDSVIVNVSVDAVSGDPVGPPYYIMAKNINSGEWINVSVTDNNTEGPWGNENSPGDGKYWGVFNVSGSEASFNATNQGETSILQVNNGDTVNISEIPGNPLDNDTDIAYETITIVEGGGGEEIPLVNTTIYGYVNDSNGASIEGVNVSAFNATYGWGNNSFTNGSGYFEFKVFGGDFEFRAEKDGFEPWQNYRSWPENDTFVEKITLSSGGGGEDPPYPSEVNITVYGTVYQDNTPDISIPNANISVRTKGNPNDILNTTTADNDGYFSMVFQPNMTATSQGNGEVELIIEAEGYETWDRIEGIWWLMDDMGCMWEVDHIYVDKIWNTTNWVSGWVKNETGAPIKEAHVEADGPYYFYNETSTNETGYFTMKTISGDFEIRVGKDGYFTNCTEIYIDFSYPVMDPLTIYLEEIPDYTAWINGTLTSNGTPLQYTEIMLFDPSHPNEGEKEDMPLTDGNGYFNISTYPGEFKLVTIARVIGKQMDAPPIGIGGYQNDVFNVTVNEGESKNIDINLSVASPDNISIDMAFSNWSYGAVAMTRAIIGNAKIIRTMIDEDISGTISEDEIQLLIEDINESLSGMEHFDEMFIFAGIPFEAEIDEKGLRITNPSVEINGITNGSSINSSDVITVFINGTLVASGEINQTSEIHSVTVECYYGNSAFEINYTVNCPNNYTFIDSTNEYVTVTGLDTANVNIVPDADPDGDDKTFNEEVSLLATSGSQIFAEMLTYYDENSFDSDGDGDYDYLITKFKFNTSEEGDFKVYGVLKSQSGTTLGESETNIYSLTGSKMVELSFDGYRINKKQKDGPYRVIANLYYKQGDSYIWIDSINKTTNSYNYTDFTSPPLYFTGQISDTTVDEDEDGLFDSLIISVNVSVGDTGNYEMEADIGICDFSYQGDPHITHIRKDVTFFDAGSQLFNFTFDGSLIYRKGSNSSLWVNIRARSYTDGELDELQYMTEKYYYTDFERPLPESCSISGNVTDVFGNPLEAEIRLMNMEIYGENNTQTNDNGSFSINCQPGKYELDVWCTNSSSYENQWETIIIGETDENETIDRNIILLPYWHECTWLDWMMDSWQYASGDPIYVNITAYGMGNSNSTLEVYKEEQDGDFWGRRLIASMSNTTDINGYLMYVINTSTFSNGQYMFQMLVYNESLPQPNVARGDAWGIQISSIALDFDINRNNYRPGSNGTGTYTLTYINNDTEVINATYEWKIMYWDWMGEHVLASDTFTNSASGNGSFDFTIPLNILNHGDWFDLKFTATDPSENEIQSWRCFGITTGSCIESVTDSGVGTEGNYDGLALNVTVNVTQGGNYRINGGLNDQSWWWIAGNETEQYLNEGSNTVWIYIEGEQIQSSGKDGPYRIWVGLYNSGDWNELDNYEYTTDTEYNYNNFSRPDVCFNTSTELTYYTVGDVDNYEALIVNASIVSSVAGNYTVHGNLHYKEQQSGDWYEWHFVAWNKSAKITIDEEQKNTTINVPIRFEGSEIYNSGRNGPYSLNFNLHRVTGPDWEEWVSVYDPEDTIQLNYSQFTKPSAYVAGITDYGTDANDNLVIGVQINVSDGNQGNYNINGNLHSAHHDGHMWITHGWNESTLDNGTNIVNLTFSGSAIYSAGYDGQYSLHVDLERVDPWQWLGGREFDTDSHIHTDFSIPGAVFVGTHLDEGYDEDGDGFYDYVRITIPVSFNETGWYEVSGELYQAEDWNWHWITWGHTDFQASEGTQNITIDFSGCEIMKSGREGQYGVNLWLRSQGCELGNLDFTTDNYYYSDEFDQPAVSFTADSPRGDSLSPGNTSVNVTLAINSSEVGTYRVNGNLHKVIQHPGGWDEWIWITHSERELTISQTGETEFSLSFDTAMIQGSGNDGPYTIDFDLMDENWMQLDFIHNYQSQPYSLSGLDDIRPAYFTGDYDDYLYPSTNPEFVKVNVTLQVNESGNYEICGDLHKGEDWNWNFIAGSWNNQYFDTGEQQNITLQFDAIEILDNIENNGLSSFDLGDNFDIDIWLRRSGEWIELDHLSTASKNTYSTSDFSSSFGASIEEVNDSGYNSTGDEKYEYLNVTVEVNFTQTGNYELWCDLSKESGYNWYWIGWKNEYITITSPETQNVTLQFSGERISSAGHDGPYKLYMELMNLDSGKRMGIYKGETESYSVSDFIGSSVEFNDSTTSAEGVDTDDAGTEYDYLLVSVNVTSESYCNVELRGDLHKESQYSGWQWISCQNNWTSLEAGENTLTLRFDGGIIRNSGIDGPYQIRLELWDTSEWKLLDVIDSLDTPAYSYENFQAPSAEIVEGNIEDWGLDTNDDGKYEYLEVNVSVNVANAGNYEVMGDLHSDTNGWHWLGWTNNWTYLDSGEQIVKLRFNGAQIKSKGIDGPYNIRIELRSDNGNILDMFEPYETESYSYGDFQSSGVELVGASDRIIDDGDYLELNVTVNCSNAGNYWIGGDLHKESGWNWQWIAWESKDVYLDDSGSQTVTILFSGEMIYNSGIDGPYQIRIELRDTDTWEEQDMIERYNTQEYSYSNFSTPSVSFVSIEDSGNDTDSNGDYNYLDLNVTINCTREGTYWIDADLHKESGWNWQWIAWKGEEVSLTGEGEQVVKIQFDGEQIYNREINGPYQVRLEIRNITTGTQLDTYEQYNTQSYNYDNFTRSSIEFVENDDSPSDRGIGTEGSYSYLEINVTINSTTAGTYWLNADLQKQSGWNWQWVAWQGQEITHGGSGEENFTILFDGSLIRNNGIDGPYKLRLELNSANGEWKQYDVIEGYDTNAYDSTDFQSAGVELVDASDGTADSIVNGNLQINVTVNSSTSGLYEIWGDLHKESGWNWQWISWNSTQVTVDDSGEQTFPLLFDGGEIYDSGIDGPYHVRIELRNVGTGSMVGSIDRYTTQAWEVSGNFSAPSAGINTSDTEDYATSEYLQVNVTTYSDSGYSTEYQVDCWLHGENWEFIGWNKTTQTINGFDQQFEIKFDGNMINSSEIDPKKVYIEMRRTSDWKLIADYDYDLQGSYGVDNFNAGIDIDTAMINSSVWDSDGDGYNNSLNVTVSIAFDTGGIYEINAGLRDNATGTWITGTSISHTSYSSDPQTITLSFDGLKIYSKGKNGPYLVSFISVSKEGIGEIAREINVHVTDDYEYTDFQHPNSSKRANLTGTYSSYAADTDDDGDYDQLIVNVTVNVTAGSYDFFGDLYSSGGTTWITSDNDSASLDEGVQIVQLKFEGEEIYNSLTNGPYLLGYVRVSADMDGTWLVLDEESNVHNTSSYNYADFDSGSQAPTLSFSSSPESVSSITTSNNPFSPNSDGTKDTTLITVSAAENQTLYLNIYDSNSAIKRTGISLSGNGTYTATWQGKDDSNTVVSDGTYRIKVSVGSSGEQVNESGTTTTVVVDTSAPTGSSITIDSGETYTTNTSVALSLIANDDSNKKMRFKNSGGNWTDWEDFQNSKSWTLTSTDGSKTVSFQAKDVAGNIATAVTDSITLDKTKPSNVNVSITGKGDTPSTYTNEVSVTLAISAEDATSGLEYMMIANDVAFTDRSWESYSTSKEWTLTSGDGTKTVYLKVKDRAGKVSDIVSDSITLDTTNPTGLSIQINSGQTYTNSSIVTLTLATTGAAKMQFSNDGTTWSSWESYSTEKTGWALSSGEGTKTVYFKAKDTAGNVATNVTDTITNDTTAPAISSVSSGGISQSSATITWTTNEAATSYVEYGTTTNYGSNTTLSTDKVTSHSQSISGLNPGATYHYRVKSKDTAGNEKASSDSTFTTSSGSDSIAPDAIAGLTVTDKTNAEKTLTLSWNESAAPDFAGYKVYRKTSSFTNVSSSGVQHLTTINTKSTTTYDDTTSTDGAEFFYAVTAIDTATPPNENKDVTSKSGTSVDDKAPVTTDNIPTGWQTLSVTVTLTATDNGKGVNKTYYTTDGSDPTNSSNINRTMYTSPFTVGGDNSIGDGTWTIKYYSYDKNTTPNVEGIHTKTLKVDTTYPATTDNAPSGWQTSSVTVTLTSTDATSGVNKIYYTKDGSTPTISSSQYSSPILFTSDGTHSLKYFAKDNATNSESAHNTTIQIDGTDPTSSINALSIFSSVPFNITWSSDDATSGIANVTIQYRNGSGDWTSWLTGQNRSGTALFTAGAVGYTYYFRSIATDNASNQESVTAYDTYTTTVSSDLNAVISSPVDATDGISDSRIYVKDTVTFTGTASGQNFLIYYLNYSADQSTWTNIANSTTPVSSSTFGTLNTSSLSDGNYTVQLRVYNSTSNNSVIIIISVDNTAPTISTNQSASVTTSSATITWTTSESANATVEYGATSSYGSTVSSSSSTFETSHSETITGLSASTTYHYSVTSYDKAGNSVNSSDGTFTTSDEQQDDGGGGGGGLPPPVENETTDEVDEPPTISDVYHEPTTVTSNDFVGVYATVTDDNTVSSVKLGWNDGTSQSKSMTLNDNDIYFAETGPFPDGITVTYWVTATDNASQTTESSSSTFTVVDKSGPSITIDKPLSGATTYDRTPMVKASYGDPSGINSSSVTITLDGTSVTKWAEITETSVYYTPIMVLEYATHKVKIEVSDLLGNTASKEWSFTIGQSEYVVEEELGNITGGEVIEITPGKSEETGIDSIDFTSTTNLTNVKVTVVKLDDKPEEITTPTEKNVYAYLDIALTSDDKYVEEDSIQSLNIKFKIELTWFDENNIDKETIVLMRHHNGEWQELSTTYISEDSTYAYFEAETTGLSTFAITGEKSAETPGVPWIIVIIAMIAAIALIIAALFKTGNLYFGNKPPKK